MAFPVVQALGEPEFDFLLGVLDRVGTVAHVSAHFDAEVTSDGAGETVLGVGGTQHHSALSNNIVARPDHADNRARGHVLNKAGEKGSAGQVRIVGLEVLSGGRNHLHGQQLVTSSLESREDLSMLTDVCIIVRKRIS